MFCLWPRNARICFFPIRGALPEQRRFWRSASNHSRICQPDVSQLSERACLDSCCYDHMICYAISIYFLGPKYSRSDWYANLRTSEVTNFTCPFDPFCLSSVPVWGGLRLARGEVQGFSPIFFDGLQTSDFRFCGICLLFVSPPKKSWFNRRLRLFVPWVQRQWCQSSCVVVVQEGCAGVSQKSVFKQWSTKNVVQEEPIGGLS